MDESITIQLPLDGDDVLLREHVLDITYRVTNTSWPVFHQLRWSPLRQSVELDEYVCSGDSRNTVRHDLGSDYERAARGWFELTGERVFLVPATGQRPK